MKTALAFLLVILAAISNADPYFANKTGEHLIRDFLGPPDQRGNLKGQDYLEHETARGYIDGVKDATQGTSWCYAGRIKPHELNFDLIDDIKALPAATLKGSAAPLIVDALRKKFPCSANRRQP